MNETIQVKEDILKLTELPEGNGFLEQVGDAPVFILTAGPDSSRIPIKGINIAFASAELIKQGYEITPKDILFTDPLANKGESAQHASAVFLPKPQSKPTQTSIK